MSKYPAVFGIDSHARTTTVCAVVVETGETATRIFPGVSPYAEVASWMPPFPGPSERFALRWIKGWRKAPLLIA